jgi:hypothetical protein
MRFSFVFASLIALTTTCFAQPAADSSQAVEAAARHYRIQLYESLRDSRHKYDQRRAVGDMLIGHWNSAGQPDAWNEELTQWFDAATEATRNNGQLPELPDLMPVTTEPPVPEVQAVVPADPAPTTTEPQGVEPTTEAPATEPSVTANTAPSANSDAAAADAPAVESSAPEATSDDATPAAPANDEAAVENGQEANVFDSIGGAFWRVITE